MSYLSAVCPIPWVTQRNEMFSNHGNKNLLFTDLVHLALQNNLLSE